MSDFTAESVDLVGEIKSEPIDTPDFISPLFIQQNYCQTANEVTVKSECDYSYLEPQQTDNIKTEEITSENDMHFGFVTDLDRPMNVEVSEGSGLGSGNPCGSNILSSDQENGYLLHWLKTGEQMSDTYTSNSLNHEKQTPITPETQETQPKAVIKVTCTYCDYNCKSQKQLDTHMWSKHRKEFPDVRSKINLNYFFHCELCEFICVTKFEVKQHRRRHGLDEDPSELLYCRKCSFKTPWRPDLERHSSIVHTEIKEEQECMYCKKKFLNKYYVAHHLLNCHKDIPDLQNLKTIFSFAVKCCTSCDFRAVKIAKLNNHIKEKHNRDKLTKFQCDNCDFETHRRSYLLKHKEKHVLRELKCEHCDRVFTKQNLLDTHLLKIHKDDTRALSCIECDFKTTYSGILQMHIAGHHKQMTAAMQSEGENYKCKHCAFVTKVEKTLLTHYITRHKKRYSKVCALCSKGFQKTVQYANHLLRTHKCETGKKLFDLCNCTIYSCETCTDFRTVLLYQYKEHMYNFHKDESFSCKVYCDNCGYSTISKRNLRNHIYTRHLNDHPFKCSYCSDQAFKSKLSLARHVLKWHKETLKSGQSDILGLKLYSCSFCNFKTLHVAVYNRHEVFVHRHC